jgi:DNA-repair protein XRCC2
MSYNVLSWSLQSYLFHFTVEEAEVPPVQESGVLSTHTSEWVQPSLKTKEKFSIVDVRPCYYYSFCLPMSRNISISLIWCKLF